MNIQAKKLTLIEWLLRVQDEKVLKKIENIRDKSDFWDELTQEEKDEIDAGIAELDKGAVHSYKDIIARHRKK
ncbi:MAG: hypothetical protein H6585_13940 [Flavobacteriales bacterium]|nr:hypothetical protein [Flavobacteriales bacterium]MCB9449430.1 hypothetical protein [Flavobacteriales bacterium]